MTRCRRLHSLLPQNSTQRFRELKVHLASLRMLGSDATSTPGNSFPPSYPNSRKRKPVLPIASERAGSFRTLHTMEARGKTNEGGGVGRSGKIRSAKKMRSTRRDRSENMHRNQGGVGECDRAIARGLHEQQQHCARTELPCIAGTALRIHANKHPSLYNTPSQCRCLYIQSIQVRQPGCAKRGRGRGRQKSTGREVDSASLACSIPRHARSDAAANARKNVAADECTHLHANKT